MKRRIDVWAEARADIAEAMDYIGRDSVDSAIRLQNAVTAAFQSLAETPGMGPALDDPHRKLRDLRKWPVHGFLNYIVFYRVFPDYIEIVGVLHGAQDTRRILIEER